MKNIKILIFLLLFLILFSACSTNRPPFTPGEPEIIAEGPFMLPFELTFIAFTTDPNDDDVSYQFDWGDGTRSEWSDFIPSGDTITESHSYLEGGWFEIKVRAQDAEMLTAWSKSKGVYFSPD
jgi:hypothetical protein